MKIKVDSYNGVEIHTIKTKKNIKGCYLTAIFWYPYDFEKEVKYSFLTRILLQENKFFPSYTKLQIEKEERYGVHLNVYNYIESNIISKIMSATFLNPKYTEEGELEKTMDLFFANIFHPNINDGKFSKETLTTNKKAVKTIIDEGTKKSVKYAIKRSLMHIDKNIIYSYRNEEEKSIIDSLNEKNLVSVYNNFLNENLKIVFVGEIDNDIVIKTIKDRLKIRNKISSYQDKLIYVPKSNKIKYITEESDFSQTELLMYYRINGLTNKEYHMHSLIAQDIIQDKLFNIIREEYSLCYGISIDIKRYHNLISILSSISYKNVDLVQKLVNDIIQNMKLGKITNKEFEAKKRKYIQNVSKKDVELSEIFSRYVVENIFNRGTKDEYIKNLKRIQKKDIIKFMNKLNLQLVYILKERE